MTTGNNNESMDLVPPVPAAPATIIPPQAETDAEVVNLWIKSKKSELSRLAYMRDWFRFHNFCPLPLNRIGIAQLQEFAEELKRRALSDASIRRMVGSIKSLITFAYRIGYVQFNPGAAVALPTAHSNVTKRILTEEQVFKLINSCYSKRDNLILRLFYLTGARRAELRGARWGDLAARPKVKEDAPEIGQITLTGKGNKQRTVLIPHGTWTALKEFRDSNDRDEDYIFRSGDDAPLDNVTYWRIVRKAGKAIDQPGISPHWLRHSHASHALDRKCSLQLISETLGHSSIVATSVYLHGRPEDSSSLYLAVD